MHNLTPQPKNSPSALPENRKNFCFKIKFKLGKYFFFDLVPLRPANILKIQLLLMFSSIQTTCWLRKVTNLFTSVNDLTWKSFLRHLKRQWYTFRALKYSISSPFNQEKQQANILLLEFKLSWWFLSCCWHCWWKIFLVKRIFWLKKLIIILKFLIISF